MGEKVIVSHGTPVNNKSLLAFIFDQMGKLNRGEIDCNKAIAQSKLAGQAIRTMEYELKRTVVQLKLNEINAGKKVELREIESKAFDNTI